MSESLKNKTVKGTVWSSLDAFLGQGITFLVGLVLATSLISGRIRSYSNNNHIYLRIQQHCRQWVQ